MDDKILKVLKYLKPFGFTAKVNIAPLINEMFPFNISDQEYDFNINRRNVIYFLEGMMHNDYIVADKSFNNLVDFRGRENESSWFAIRGYEAYITSEGLSLLEEEQKSKIEVEAHSTSIEANKSTIKLNESIDETNKSVRQTNKLMEGHAQTQNSISEKQTLLIDNQTTILSSQRKYLYMTVFFAGISALTAILSYISSMSKEQLQQQLQSQSQQIHTLQIELSQATNRLYLEKEAKKTSPKKK